MTISATPLLLCDGAWENPRNRKVHLEGIFTTIRMSRFPSPERFLVVYTQLHGEPHERGALRLDCIEESTGLPIVRSEGVTELGVHGMRHIRFSFQGLQFPEPGRYTFSLSCDGRVIGETALVLRESM